MKIYPKLRALWGVLRGEAVVYRAHLDFDGDTWLYSPSHLSLIESTIRGSFHIPDCPDGPTLWLEPPDPADERFPRPSLQLVSVR